MLLTYSYLFFLTLKVIWCLPPLSFAPILLKIGYIHFSPNTQSISWYFQLIFQHLTLLSEGNSDKSQKLLGNGLLSSSFFRWKFAPSTFSHNNLFLEFCFHSSKNLIKLYDNTDQLVQFNNLITIRYLI